MIFPRRIRDTISMLQSKGIDEDWEFTIKIYRSIYWNKIYSGHEVLETPINYICRRLKEDYLGVEYEHK